VKGVNVFIWLILSVFCIGAFLAAVHSSAFDVMFELLKQYSSMWILIILMITFPAALIFNLFFANRKR
jgi:hypothetical protein